MRMFVSVAGLATLLCLAVPSGFAKTPTAPKSGPGTIVIVFKDGHRQSFNLSEIDRVEFPAASAAAAASDTGSSNSPLPSRGRFLGKWEVGVGDGTTSTFYITLDEDGNARKSMGSSRGSWVYVDGEAHITWDDGWRDAIRKVGPRYQKFAYGSGKSFSDTADNVTGARNTTPNPI